MSRSPNCLFCRIAKKEIPSDVVYETKETLGFKDIHPQAPVHLLFIPKRHVATIAEIDAAADPIAGALIAGANQLARELKIVSSGYRLVINCNKDGGQEVDHLHLHLLGKRAMNWPPG